MSRWPSGQRPLPRGGTHLARSGYRRSIAPGRATPSLCANRRHAAPRYVLPRLMAYPHHTPVSRPLRVARIHSWFGPEKRSWARGSRTALPIRSPGLGQLAGPPRPAARSPRQQSGVRVRVPLSWLPTQIEQVFSARSESRACSNRPRAPSIAAGDRSTPVAAAAPARTNPRSRPPRPQPGSSTVLPVGLSSRSISLSRCDTAMRPGSNPSPARWDAFASKVRAIRASAGHSHARSSESGATSIASPSLSCASAW